MVLTSGADEGERQAALRAGAAAFLEKPVDAQALLDAVRRAAGW